jgi:hypothetical protein
VEGSGGEGNEEAARVGLYLDSDSRLRDIRTATGVAVVLQNDVYRHVMLPLLLGSRLLGPSGEEEVEGVGGDGDGAGGARGAGVAEGGANMDTKVGDAALSGLVGLAGGGVGGEGGVVGGAGAAPLPAASDRMMSNRRKRREWTLAVLCEYITSLVQINIPVEVFLDELLVRLLVDDGRLSQLHQLLQYVICVEHHFSISDIYVLEYICIRLCM